jgi:hypothetical protein
VYINLKNSSSLVKHGIIPAKARGEVWIWVKKFSKKAKTDSPVALAAAAELLKERDAAGPKAAAAPVFANTTAAMVATPTLAAEVKANASIDSALKLQANEEVKGEATKTNATVVTSAAAVAANASSVNSSKAAANKVKAVAAATKAGSGNKACQKFTTCAGCGQNTACGWCATDNKCYGGDSDGPAKAICEQWTFHSCPSNATALEDAEVSASPPPIENATTPTDETAMTQKNATASAADTVAAASPATNKTSANATSPEAGAAAVGAATNSTA